MGTEIDQILDRGLLNPEWQKQQIKTFTAWCNSHLSKVNVKIEKLDEDFRDGLKLMLLLEIISDERLPKPETGRLRIHHVNNVKQALDFIKSKDIFVSIGAQDIVDGNLKLTLGLVWILIHQYTIKRVDFGDASEKDGLLKWFNDGNEFAVKNFHNDIKDGLALCSLLNKYKPDLIDLKKIKKEDPLYNLNFAFELAENFLGVPKMLDPKDMEKPDEKAVMTYIATLYLALNDNSKEKMNFESETYLIEMAEDCPNGCLEYLEQCLKISGLSVDVHEMPANEGPTYLTIQASFDDLCREVYNVEQICRTNFCGSKIFTNFVEIIFAVCILFLPRIKRKKKKKW